MNEWFFGQWHFLPTFVAAMNRHIATVLKVVKGRPTRNLDKQKNPTSSIFNILTRLERGSSTLKCWYNLKFPYNFLTRSKISVGRRQFLYNLFFYIWIYDDPPPIPPLYAIWLVSKYVKILCIANLSPFVEHFHLD